MRETRFCSMRFVGEDTVVVAPGEHEGTTPSAISGAVL